MFDERVANRNRAAKEGGQDSGAFWCSAGQLIAFAGRQLIEEPGCAKRISRSFDRLFPGRRIGQRFAHSLKRDSFNSDLNAKLLANRFKASKQPAPEAQAI